VTKRIIFGTKRLFFDTKSNRCGIKLEAQLQALLCVSAASYNLVIGEAYYFLAAGRQTRTMRSISYLNLNFLKPAQFKRIACTSLPLDERNINLGI
jgi:hypothetical protein